MRKFHVLVMQLTVKKCIKNCCLLTKPKAFLRFSLPLPSPLTFNFALTSVSRDFCCCCFFRSALNFAPLYHNLNAWHSELNPHVGNK